MKKILVVIIYILIASSLFAQKTKNAEKAYNDGNYPLAIEEYTNLVELTEDAQLKAQFRYYVGESYRKMNRPDKAERPYLDAIKNGYISGDIYRALGEVQLKQGKYDEAQASFEAYKRYNPSDPLAQIGIESCKSARINTFVNPFFDPQPITRVNSGKNELGVSYFNDGLIFSSNRAMIVTDDDDDEEEDEGKKKKKSYTRSGLGATKVYMASGNNGTFGRAIEITELNKMKDFSNDGVFSYDPYSRQGFYARSDGRKSYIQFMEYKGSKWIKKDKIDIDSKREPIGHPHITPDGNRIYFTSTMAGGFGKSDIWYIERNGKAWSTPINAGDKVNTAGNEVYPIIAEEYMIFASDGHIGFGGFDLFSSKILNGELQKPVNLGHPFNTHADDYNMAIRTDMGEGVFVSGRNIRRGDDIYYFKGFPSSIIVSGVVSNRETGAPVSSVTIELIENKTNKVVNKAATDTEGKYSLFVEPEQKYTLKASVAGYPPTSLSLETDAERFGCLNDTDLKLAAASTSVISGRVYSRITFMSLENQDVSLLANGKVVQTVKTNFDGIYKFGNIKENTQYSIKVSPSGYFADNKQLATTSLSRNIELNKASGYDTDFALDELTANKETLMSSIEFPKGKSNILSESFTELDRLADLFAKNPECKILITAYTDARANAKTATDLTNKRAEAVKTYLTARGVNAAQVSIKGMGRSKLLVSGARTEEEHKRNNRVTYTITGISETPVSVVTTPVTSTPGKGTQPVTGTATTPQPAITQPSTGTGQPTAGAYADLPFRIQVMAIKMLKTSDPLFTKIKSGTKMDVHHAVGADGWYRYYVGGFSTREEASVVLAKIKSMGIDGMIKPKTAF